ncbi:hypothetical protein ACIQVR_41780 [Streptomyces xanthochromogenes]|uniref:hypothetical protein n=1 Tax=Streptomyces xanthochromogenes TaxID=67384 RepID=UPI0038074E10
MATDFPPIVLTAAEWDELIFAADGAEEAMIGTTLSIYDSIKHWVSAVLPLHERMIRERLNADLASMQSELTEARQKVRICEQQAARLDAENRKLREPITLGRCADCIEIAEAVDADLDDDDIDAMMRTANDAMVHQLNDVLDVDAGLSEILTRREGA